MRCPICDQKLMNCDCTPEERRMHAEIEALESQEARLRLTDEEREAVAWAASCASDREHPAEATLRGLLERL
jgi:hypothetical protein